MEDWSSWSLQVTPKPQFHCLHGENRIRLLGSLGGLSEQCPAQRLCPKNGGCCDCYECHYSHVGPGSREGALPRCPGWGPDPPVSSSPAPFSLQQMVQALMELAQRDHGALDCCVVVILSHGCQVGASASRAGCWSARRLLGFITRVLGLLGQPPPVPGGCLWHRWVSCARGENREHLQRDRLPQSGREAQAVFHPGLRGR